MFKGEISYTTEELKKILKITKKSYNRFNNITSKIIQPAIEEINQKTDINVEYKTLKQGVKAIGVKLYISKSDEKILKLKNDSHNDNNKLKFNNFTPREYDYNSLEWQLLGWNKE